jgi:UTP-glucose-1-phosphate uridylyltransferase
MTSLTKSVLPVAGLGTRFLPASKTIPIIDKAIIAYAVEEAIAAGITEPVFVTGRTKWAIEDHFNVNPKLVRELHEKGKDDVAAAIRGILAKTPPDADGEIQLADAINIRSGQRRVNAVPLSTARYDCGSKFGYLEAIVDFALDHPDYGPAFGALIAQRARGQAA